jgi:hypothetical protein
MTPRALALGLTLALCGPASADSQLSPECPLAEARPDTQALILWVGAARATTRAQGTHFLGPVRAVARLRRGKLEPYDGENLRDGMRVWNALAPSDSPLALTSVSSFLDDRGETHCVYAADVRPGQPKGTLLASAHLPGAFRAPSPQDTAYFRSRNPQAELLALSDLDANGEPEYWAAEPTPGDTGVSVWQRTSMGLERVFGACSGCSD